MSRHEEGERDLAIWDVLIASALLFPYEIEPEWPSWGLPLGVHSRMQSTCLRCCADLRGTMFEAGACDLV